MQGDTVTREGRYGRQIYFIREGSLKIYKQVEVHVPAATSKASRDFPVNQICAGSIVGDEILFLGKNYKYTVKVESSSCKMLLFEKNINMRDFATKFIHNILGDQFYEKENQRKSQIDRILQNQPEKFLEARGMLIKTHDAIDNMKEDILGRY